MVESGLRRREGVVETGEEEEEGVLISHQSTRWMAQVLYYWEGDQHRIRLAVVVLVKGSACFITPLIVLILSSACHHPPFPPSSSRHTKMTSNC